MPALPLLGAGSPAPRVLGLGWAWLLGSLASRLLAGFGSGSGFLSGLIWLDFGSAWLRLDLA